MTETAKPASPRPLPAEPPQAEPANPAPARAAMASDPIKKVPEIGGPPGPEPTRYGDWQFNGKVTDF
jgi:hypothetical protein